MDDEPVATPPELVDVEASHLLSPSTYGRPCASMLAIGVEVGRHVLGVEARGVTDHRPEQIALRPRLDRVFDPRVRRVADR